MEKLTLSPVKREKLKKQEKLKQKEKMRADLPVLTRDEVRRYRLPLHEALFIELQERGLLQSAHFIRQLIDYQEYLRKTHGPESLIYSKPRLLDRPKVLDFIGDSLTAAERAHNANDIAGECDHLIKLSVHFALGSDDWWWLGEQLMMESVHTCAHYAGDAARRNATCRYIYGKFLLENLHDRKRAMKQLSRARKLSQGFSWTATKFLHCLQKTVFVESCILLYKTLLEDANEILMENPKQAIKLCAAAKRRAYDACDHDGEAIALMLQGKCQIIAGDPSAAAQSFYKVFLIYTKRNKIEERCEARICLLQAYLKLGNWTESYSHLKALLEFAKEHNLPYYIGQSYRYLGEYYLMHGNPNFATPLLIKAINAFHEIGDVDNREQTKNFAAVSAGQELMPKYVYFILKCGEEGHVGHSSVRKLLRWKDTRDVSWSESVETISPMHSKTKSSLLELEAGDELVALLEEGIDATGGVAEESLGDVVSGDDIDNDDFNETDNEDVEEEYENEIFEEVEGEEEEVIFGEGENEGLTEEIVEGLEVGHGNNVIEEMEDLEGEDISGLEGEDIPGN